MTDKKLDFNSFAGKLGAWAEKLRPFIESEAMWTIMQKIKTDSMSDTIVPKSTDTFRAFATTVPDNVKVMFYLMDPYPRKYSNGEFQATGIAMDCTNSPDKKIQPSLVKWYDAISSSEGYKVNYSPSLQYLHDQGVMLLNTDLTCKLNKTQSHEKLWEPFQKYLLEDVLGSDTGIIYVLCGKASLRMKRYINPFCKTFELSHPAAASHISTDWDYKNIFKTINKILGENNGYTIYWDKDKWDEASEPPF